jgi:hypothetical protein
VSVHGSAEEAERKSVLSGEERQRPPKLFHALIRDFGLDEIRRSEVSLSREVFQTGVHDLIPPSLAGIGVRATRSGVPNRRR